MLHRSASIRFTTLAGRAAGFLLRGREARLLGADQLDHGVLVAIFEFLRLELTAHLVDNGLGEGGPNRG